MPKKFLHDALTHHHHNFQNHSKCNPSEKHIAIKGFNCNTDNLVVETVYGITLIPDFNFATLIHSHHFNESSSFFAKIISERTHLRGPPSC